MKFIACGGEDHVIVGRFKDLGRNDTLFVGTRRTGNIYTYTIIDDVELILTNPAPDFYRMKRLFVKIRHSSCNFPGTNGA